MAYITKPTTLMKIWATAGVKETPADSKIQQGWVVELPPYQYDNWLENRQDTFIAHVNQSGIPVWDSVTDYQGGKSYVQGSDGNIYKALQTNSNADPTNPLNSTYWNKAFEEYGSVQVLQTSLNNHLTNYSTLSGISNVAAARNNIVVYSKGESDTKYALKEGNSTQVFSVANATLNEHAINRGQVLSLITSATETVAGVAEIADQSEMNVGTDNSRIVTPLKGKATYLMRANNLSDLSNVATARTNLGLTSTATTPITDLLTKAGNLSGISDTTTARVNLGLGTIAVENAVNWLSKAGNLSGLASLSASRTNLGLGNSATLNVGTTVGTVAAGDDSRIVNATPNTRQVTAGNGLSGGGDLSVNRTVTLGTPSTISVTSSNSVGTSTHSHAFDLNSFFGDRSITSNGWYTLPGGFMVQWGTSTIGGGSNQVVTDSFNLPFIECVFVQVGTQSNKSSGVLSQRKAELIGFTATGFTWGSDNTADSGSKINCTWIAFGRV